MTRKQADRSTEPSTNTTPEMPGKWAAAWQAGEWTNTLRWLLQLGSLKPNRSDSYFVRAGALVQRLSVTVRDLVETVATEDRLQQDVRSVWSDSRFGQEWGSEVLDEIRQLHEQANQRLVEVEDGSDEFFRVHDRYSKQLMKPASDLEDQLIAIVEREIDETSRRIFRFSKKLDEGIHPLDLHKLVTLWYPMDKDPDPPAPKRQLFALNEPKEGGGDLTRAWLKELQQLWTEIGVEQSLPLHPLEEMKRRWAEIGIGVPLPEPAPAGPTFACGDPIPIKCQALEEIKSIARKILAESFFVPEEWIIGRRGTLNQALGKSRTNPRYLESLDTKGVLKLRRLGLSEFAIQMTDPRSHKEVRAKFDDLMKKLT